MFIDSDGLHGRPLPPNWGCVFRGVLAAAVSPLDHVLAGMVAAGLGAEALCLYLGFARTMLFSRLAGLGLPPPHEKTLRRPGGRNPWSAEDVRRLISLWAAGVHVRGIAEEIGRSRGGIYGKSRRLGLPPRNRKYLVYLKGPESDGLYAEPASPLLAVAEPVSARSTAAATLLPAAEPVVPFPAPLFGFDAVLAEPPPALSPVFESLADKGQFPETGEPDGPIAVPVAPGGDASLQKLAAHEFFESVFVPFESETGPESIRSRPPELIEAMDRLEDLWKRARGAGNDPDWTRMKLRREFVLELALRGLANQSNAAIADAMGITRKKSGDWLSRLHIRRVLPDVTCEFDVERAFAKLEKEKLVPRTCKQLKRLFFASKRENVQYCREGWRQLNKIREGASVFKEEPPGKRWATPSLPVLKFMSQPMPEGWDEPAPRRFAGNQGSLFG